MLKYFAEHRDLEQVKSIFAALNRTKDRLQRGEYSAPLQDFDNCKHLFDDIKALAIQNKDGGYAVQASVRDRPSLQRTYGDHRLCYGKAGGRD